MNKKEIIAKVLKDEPKGFREQFLNDPKKTIEEVTGGSLEDWNIEIIRLPEKTILFTLPEKMPSPEGLTEEMIIGYAAGVVQTEFRIGLCKNPSDEHYPTYDESCVDTTDVLCKSSILPNRCE